MGIDESPPKASRSPPSRPPPVSAAPRSTATRHYAPSSNTTSTPPTASVGLNESVAKERFGDDSVETLVYDLGGNGKSQILGTSGSVKLVRQKGGPVVGVHIVGARAGELLGEAQVVVGLAAVPDDLAALVHAHPTQNEALGEAFLALAGKPLHAHT